MFGAICGDVLGSEYEFEEIKYEKLGDIVLCREYDTFTDDTALTLAVADWLLHDIEECYNDDEALKDKLAHQLLKYSLDTFYLDEGNLSFGGRYFDWCKNAYYSGEHKPYNSFGNGSGMRVSPVGWFFDTMEETMRFAKLSADVTHNHPEGEKGAMCIAAAIFLARNGKSKEEIKDYLLKTFGYELLNKSVAELRRECVWSDICRDTVPMSIVAFLESQSFEDAVKNAISYGSDSDTIADMAGAVAEAYYGKIPDDIFDFCISKIPERLHPLLNEFYKRTHKPIAG